MNRLDSLDISIIRTVYNSYCTPDKRYITPQRFADMLNSTGERDTALIEALFVYADTSEYMLMSFEEFAAWWIAGEYRKKWRFPRSRTLLKEGHALFKRYAKNSTTGKMGFEQFSTLLSEIDRDDEYGDIFDGLTGYDNELSFKKFYSWLKW